ncbi:MAG: ATP-dependent DNA helicase [Candidatus Woesearchaeota archaeon]
MYFPFDNLRPEQGELLEHVDKAVKKGGCHLAHAPTGLGKTAASLAPAITYAIENDKVVFFLTSRLTQHALAINTIKAIRKKFDIEIPTIDFIGRQRMCPVNGVSSLSSREFSEYCKAVRSDNTCSFYQKTRTQKNTLTKEAQFSASVLRPVQPLSAEELVAECQKAELCPYELSLHLASKARVIVADYYYLFNDSIRDNFLGRINRDLEDIIVIVDEAHNLPSRIRDLLTQKITPYALRRAQKEAQKYGFGALATFCQRIHEHLQSDGSSERLVKRDEFMEVVGSEYDSLIEDLDKAGETIREEQKQSSLGGLSLFLAAWKGPDKGFARIFSSGKGAYSLTYHNLDPSLLSGPVFSGCHSAILMSGTLTPTAMYRDLLGLPSGTTEHEYDNPFPDKNRKVIINPAVTTKYAARGPEEFRNIAGIISDIVNTIPGNTAVFFPSYQLKKEISSYMSVKKTVLEEHSDFTSQERSEIIETFKKYQKSGAVLLAVAAGSFGEGIDLPGDLLKGVVVVGLPLQPPTLLIKELINYYNAKFSKGWDYGYILPAITKSLQNAGRCIRTEDDRGIIAFLDKRYTFPQYFSCFPGDWNISITKDHVSIISDFFS